MKAPELTKTMALGLVVLGLCCPARAIAGNPATARPAGPPLASSVIDVALSPEALLRGQVVDRQGMALAGRRVSLIEDNREVAATLTDEQGRFALRVPRGGVYLVAAAEGRGLYRVWHSQAAPPAALPEVLIVSGAMALRGQNSPVYEWIQEHPVLFYTGIAAAITVPLVVFGGDDDEPASP